MFRNCILLLLTLLVGCTSKTDTDANVLTVAAASDLRFVLGETIRQFKQTNPAAEIKPIYGSSGSFFAQIQHGAPFDLFLSADMDYLDKLAESGFAFKDTEFEHAVGRLVVWAKKESPIDVEKLGIDALTDSKAMRIAIANPQHAPYGRGAVAAMQKLGVYDKVRDRLVFGENVSETLEFVDSGAAQIGIVALSLAVAPTVKPKGKYWEIPLDAYPRMAQGGIVLKATKNKKAADELRSFILSNQGREIFKDFGFYMPEEKR
jgi:molybdate transport system substrate-binding protein